MLSMSGVGGRPARKVVGVKEKGKEILRIKKDGYLYGYWTLVNTAINNYLSP